MDTDTNTDTDTTTTTDKNANVTDGTTRRGDGLSPSSGSGPGHGPGSRPGALEVRPDGGGADGTSVDPHERQPLLTIEGLTRTFGGIVALDEFEATVTAGEITGLIGPNGAGKTTLFNVISGILPPDEGTVRFRGQDLVGRPPHEVTRAGVARTFQTPRPVRSLTVAENLLVARHFGRAEDTASETNGGSVSGPNGGTGAADPTVDRVLELLGLADRRNAVAESLQIVERKYVDLARALAMDPAVILLDEMMAGLNPTETTEMVETIKHVHRTFDVDFLLIEHNLRAIRSAADAVIVIHEGRHLATGSPAAVLDDPDVQEAYVG
jgi:branched-chain amino acid transport system ATP-binding protein